MATLADRYLMLAPDSYGAGQSPEWRGDRPLRLQDEVDLLEPVFDRAGSSFVLVGHSYGGAIALRAAATRPERVRALVVYEPTLFSVIEAEGASPNDADGIRQVIVEVAAALNAGALDEAARCFIDYWMGPGSWAKTPDKLKAPIVNSIRHAPRWAEALFLDPTSLEELQHQLRMPVLYLTGSQSTQAAHGVARRLIKALPNVKHLELSVGHMGPVTNPDIVNEVVDEFLMSVFSP